MRSWSKPAELDVAGEGVVSEGYDQTQKAYVLRCPAGRPSGGISFTLKASADSPVINPALVVKGWGDANAKLTLNGKAIPRGKEFRYNHRRPLEGTDLIVWLQADSTVPIETALAPFEK